MGIVIVDTNGNAITNPNRTAVVTNIGGWLSAGQDYKIQRNMRVSPGGTLRTTREVFLFFDSVEGSTVNTTIWTQSLTTMTITQASGVTTYNAGSSIATNVDAIQTSIRQFPRLPRMPLVFRQRARCVFQANAFIEFGFGAPAGVTAAITNGAFFRWSGTTLQAVIAANGELTPVTMTGPASSNYAIYEIFWEDDHCLFQVWTSDGTLLDAKYVELATTTVAMSVSHIPCFNRVYDGAAAPGVAAQMLVTGTIVLSDDVIDSWPFNAQQSYSGKHGLILPTTYVQTPQLAAGAAPTAFTPSNTAAGNAFFGGEALCNATATSENLLSVFAPTIVSPYTFMLDGIYIGVPLNTVVAVATTATVLEWFVVVNCATGNISTGGGQRFVIPNSFFTAAVALGANALFSGTPAQWTFPTPIACNPGTTLHIGYKVILGTATATEVYRCHAMVSGYWV